MSRILIVCPTITGREDDLERCKESYKRTLSEHTIRFTIPVDQPSWGHGVNEGVESAIQVYGELEEFDYIHLTADDLEAHDGWFDAAEETLQKGMYPAPLLLNPDQSVAGFGHGDANMFDTSVDWKPTLTSVIPTMTSLMWSMMGPMIPLQYFTDDFFSHRARQFGFNTVARKAYCFTHHESQVLADGHHGSRDARLKHDHILYRQYLSTGKWPNN